MLQMLIPVVVTLLQRVRVQFAFSFPKVAHVIKTVSEHLKLLEITFSFGVGVQDFQESQESIKCSVVG